MQPLCNYLRYIDLVAVYQQLDGYSNGYTDSIGNVPSPLAERLALHFQNRAEYTISILYDDNADWEMFSPVDLAAEVGDYIERDIEDIEGVCSITAPTYASTMPIATWFERYVDFVREAHDALTIRDWFELEALLIYQYDSLCWLNSQGFNQVTIQVYEGITDTVEMLAHGDANHIRQLLASRKAKALADKSHRETNLQKGEALRQWDEHGQSVSSMAAFARARHKDFGVTERTLYGWIRDHKKRRRK